VNDGRALRITGNILISILVATGLPLVVAMCMVDYFAANPQQGCFSEVQCIEEETMSFPTLPLKDVGLVAVQPTGSLSLVGLHWHPCAFPASTVHFLMHLVPFC